MVKVTNKDYYMDGYLKTNLDKIKSVEGSDWDFIFIVDGKERRGKSVMAQQVAYYLDNTLCLDRIVFNSKQFIEAVDKAEKFQAIVYDEAYSSTNSSAAMGEVARALKTKLTMIGKKNLYIFIVLPPFFDLNKYIAIWRSAALIHIYTGDNFERGYFSFYDDERKKNLYIFGRKEYNYSVTKPNFFGRFTNFWVIDREGYDKKKDAAITEETKANEAGPTPFARKCMNQRDILIQILHRDFGWDNDVIGKAINMAPSGVRGVIYELTHGPKS